MLQLFTWLFLCMKVCYTIQLLQLGNNLLNCAKNFSASKVTDNTGHFFFFDQNVTRQWAHVSGLFFHADSENQVSFALTHLVFSVYITPFDWK